MPGRTVSGSSDLSLTSDDGEDRLPSGQTTPTPSYQSRRYTSSHQPTSAAESAPAAPREAFSSGSRPISIDIPQVKKLNTSSVYTPPEPLSARGDLSGGYFPLHEDPNSRIHRPHPFHRENGPVRNHSVAEGEATAGTQKPSMAAPTNIPVASYYPTGYSENSLPMGKYYPSNYERTQKQKKNRSAPSSAGEPNSPVALSQAPASSEAESRRRLQEYQRDMMAQVTSRAHELLGRKSQGKNGSPKHKALAGMKGLPSASINLGPTLLRPNSPRLHPLGSPGPVTPMELETNDGNYFNKGKRGSPADAPGKGYHAHTM